MGAIANQFGPAERHEPQYYPVANDKPFTHVIMGEPGDPLYVDPSLPHSLSGTQVSLDKFVNILQTLNKEGQGDVDPQTGIMVLLGMMGIVVASMVGVRPPEGTEPYLVAGLVMLLLVKTMMIPPVSESIAKTVGVWKQFTAGPIPSCEMKLTDKAIETIKQKREFPNELKDVLTLDKINDPVIFFDREDTSMTIFERSSALALLQRGMLHPITKRPLDRDKLVELPALKRQIEELSQDPNIEMT